MSDTRDKDGRHLRPGDRVHLEIDGHPYSGVVDHFVWQDHDATILTVIQLTLPVTETSRKVAVGGIAP